MNPGHGTVGKITLHSDGLHMKIIFLTGLLLMSTNAVAATNEDILVCAGIKNDTERLSCFDAVAKLLVARETGMPENYILQRFKKPADK